MAKAVPDGFNTVSTYLIVPNAVEAMEFYAKAFGAKAVSRMPGPDGQSTMHAEMCLGDSMLMLSDENPEWGMTAPATLGGTASSLHLYVEDADAAFKRAVDAGCAVEFPVDDVFWGDRYAKVKDPYGHSWGIATHTEDLSDDELQKRAAEWFASMGDGCQDGEG